MAAKKLNKCSECGESLAGKKISAKTCSASCRRSRSRRVQRARKNAIASRKRPGSIEIQELEQLANDEVTDIARDIVRDELTPVMRDALTDEVMYSIRDMVMLGPKMVAAVSRDMESMDSVVRQKAYTLWAKYTLGNPVLAPAEATQKPMTVVFNGMPRPETEAAPIVEEPIDTNVDMRTCVVCSRNKLAEEFVQHSERCIDCHRVLQERAASFLQ